MSDDGKQDTFGAVVIREIHDDLTLRLAWERGRTTVYNRAAKTGAQIQNDPIMFQAQLRF